MFFKYNKNYKIWKSISNKNNFRKRFIIFNKICTLKKTYDVTEIKLTNNPIFNFKATFYPLFYYINNNDYYIVSSKNENSNPNYLTTYKGGTYNTIAFNNFQFSKLNILTPININQFIAAYSNSNSDKCLISLFDFTDNSITTTNFSSLCTSSDENEFINIYNINNNYVYMHYVSGIIVSGSLTLSTSNNFIINSNTSHILDNSDCQNVSQLQVVSMDNSITKICFYNPSKSKVCYATGIYENNEYKLGNFVSSLIYNDVGYFSMYKLINDLSIVCFAGSDSENLKYNIYIIITIN